MKRSMPWSTEENDSSSDESLSSGSDSGADNRAEKKSKTGQSKGKVGSRKKKAVDFESLQRHGYRGGLSVLGVPPPEEKPDWSWSTGKESREARELEESYEKRQTTRAAVLEGEQLVNVQTRGDKRNLSFSQKEKRKRELGEASRGKNYVEEEKKGRIVSTLVYRKISPINPTTLLLPYHVFLNWHIN